MEKKGSTVKMVYEFDTSANLEIYLPNLKDWYRVTCRDFRSYDGKRRINGVPYEGPIYLFATNKEVPFNNTGKYIGYTYVAIPGKHRT